MENDAIAILAAMVENEGGTYNLPVEALQAVVDGKKGVALESFDGGQSVTLTLAGPEDLDSVVDES